MLISAVNAPEQTFWFILLLCGAVLVTLRKKLATNLSKDTTLELKGFAIFAVLFAHIGYALVDDSRFLFPLSIWAGVAVNLFLFLSGYGLTRAHQAQPLTPIAFYRKRLPGLFVPLWISLIATIFLDAVHGQHVHAGRELVQSFFGFFPSADLYRNINSPLWYFTFIIAYYLAFPWVMRRASPRLAAFILTSLGLLITALPLPVTDSVRTLYQLHIFAFPLGILCASQGFVLARIRPFWNSVRSWVEQTPWHAWATRVILLLGGLLGFYFFSFHAAIGQGIWREQAASLAALACLLAIFLLKPVESRLLNVFGLVSYEIYLLHWPIMSRHDVLYAHLPALTATTAYLCLLIVLGAGLQSLTNFLLPSRATKPSSIRQR